MRSQRKILAILLLIGFAASSFAYTSFQVDSRLSILKSNRGTCRQTALCVRATTDQDDPVNEKTTPPSACAVAGAAKQPHGRRQALAALTTFAVVGSSTLLTTSMCSPANAFDKTFPDELTELDPQLRGISLGSRTNSQQRAKKAAVMAKTNQQNLANFNVQNDLLPSVIWGGALWLLTGSRSNPLATPLANVLYDETKEAWLKDRNAGLFAAPPLVFLFVLGFVFVCLGVVTQFLLLQLAEGDSVACLQLAGVSLIGGGSLELGRIASGEKGETRGESDRTTQLKEEFDEFASKRLLPGGNCHRSDVVSAFRRYFAKYRQADSEKYPLLDLEIEQLLRDWNRFDNRGRQAERTSAGFYYGIQLNKDADVFA
jgi:hypothetical protein